MKKIASTCSQVSHISFPHVSLALGALRTRGTRPHPSVTKCDTQNEILPETSLRCISEQETHEYYAGSISKVILGHVYFHKHSQLAV